MEWHWPGRLSQTANKLKAELASGALTFAFPAVIFGSDLHWRENGCCWLIP